MKRCWMLVACLGLGACMTEQLPGEANAVHKGALVPVPPVTVYAGGALPVATTDQIWVITASPIAQGEDLAVLVDTKTDTITKALRVPPGYLAQLNLQLGTDGSGYIHPPPGPVGRPPQPEPVLPDLWPTWYVRVGNLAADAGFLATQELSQPGGGY